MSTFGSVGQNCFGSAVLPVLILLPSRPLMDEAHKEGPLMRIAGSGSVHEKRWTLTNCSPEAFKAS